MKYTLLCIGLALFQGLLLLDFQGPIRVLLLWSILSCLIVAWAYAAQKPLLIMGKRRDGGFSWFRLILNLPWLLFTWLTWWGIAALIREDAMNHIEGTGIHLSRWPLFGVDLSEFDLVIDLGAELPPWYRVGAAYEALPNLDDMPLQVCQPTSPIDRQTRLLIHCAQGHGRTASMATLLLIDLGFAQNVDEARRMILNARPRARMSEAQRHFIQRRVAERSGTSEQTG